MQTGSWGATIFLVSSAKIMTPNSTGLEREAKFEDHPVQGDFPRPEFLAPGLLTVSLAVLLRADLGVDPYGEAQALEAALIAGEVRRNTGFGKGLSLAATFCRFA